MTTRRPLLVGLLALLALLPLLVLHTSGQPEQLERGSLSRRLAADPEHAGIPLDAPANIGVFRAPTRPKVRFGERISGRRGTITSAPPPEQPAEELHQLSLF